MEIIKNSISEFFDTKNYFDNAFVREQTSTREDFLKILPKGSIGAEFGVFKGDLSKEILTLIKPKKIVLCDTWWNKYGDFYPDWGESTQFGKLETKTAYNMLLKNINKYKDKCNIIVGESTKTILQFPDKYFDWIYLNSSHNISDIVKELKASSTKVKTAGYITGNSWIEKNNITNGLYRGIMEFCKDSSWKIMYVDNFGQWCLRNIK